MTELCNSVQVWKTRMAFMLLQAVGGLGLMGYLPSIDTILKPKASSDSDSQVVHNRVLSKDGSQRGFGILAALTSFGYIASTVYSLYHVSLLMQRDHSYVSNGFFKTRKTERIQEWKWPMHKLEGDYFMNNDGLLIYVRTWKDVSSSPKGCVIVLHGLMEHSGLYDATARALNKENFLVVALDLQGHGRSEGDQYFVRRFTDYVEDVVALIHILKAQFPQLDLYLFGNSMSGLVATLAAEKTQKDLRGLVLSSPTFGTSVNSVGIPLAVVGFLSLVFPHLPILSFKTSDLTRSAKIKNILDNDPLRTGKAPARTGAEWLEAMPQGFDASKTLALPLLVIHGTTDAVTPLTMSERFVKEYMHGDKSFFQVPNGRHDVMLEDNGGEALSALIAWLNAHAKSNASIASAVWASTVTDTVANVIKQGLTNLKQ